jgi:hypothetical protein
LLCNKPAFSSISFAQLFHTVQSRFKKLHLITSCGNGPSKTNYHTFCRAVAVYKDSSSGACSQSGRRPCKPAQHSKGVILYYVHFCVVLSAQSNKG